MFGKKMLSYAHRTIGLCLAVICLAGTATAQSAPAQNWDGLSVGINLSQTKVEAGMRFASRALLAHPDGYEGGVDVSLEYMASISSNALVGVEVLASKNFGAAGDIASYNSGRIQIAEWKVDADQSLRLMGKVAFAPSPNTIFFVGAGVEKIKFDVRETDLYGVDAGTTASYSDTMTGHVIAVGLDQRVSERLSLRFEVSHTRQSEYLQQHTGVTPHYLTPDTRSFKIGARYQF